MYKAFLGKGNSSSLNEGPRLFPSRGNNEITLATFEIHKVKFSTKRGIIQRDVG